MVEHGLQGLAAHEPLERRIGAVGDMLAIEQILGFEIDGHQTIEIGLLRGARLAMHQPPAVRIDLQ